MTGTVLVTGATRGLGLAIAEHLLSTGWTVVGLARSSTLEYEALQRAHPAQSFFKAADMADTAAMPALVREIEQSHGPLFALVNNAATGRGGVLATMHQTEIDLLMATNLVGAITLTKFVVRGMMARRAGRIVNISSIGARVGYHGMSVYAATKAGLEGFSRALAREVGRRGVTVNCVAPGFLDTSMTSGYDEEQRTRIRRRAAIDLPEPAEVAAAVGYLLSPASGRVTGTTITVDGGSSI